MGYAASEAEVRDALVRLQGDPAALVLVAERSVVGVVGWLQASAMTRVESGTWAEIVGLVVASSARGQGVGAVLVSSAAGWARATGLAEIRVRSRVARERAHRFYLRLGFREVKRQAVFALSLDAGGSPDR